MTGLPRRASALLAGGLLVLLSTVLAALPAQAHDRLESSSPADGAVVGVAPASVVLTFDAPVIALGSKVVVTGPDGTVVSTGEPQFLDTTVTQRLAGDPAAGQYRVEWRVTSSDGHPVSGTFAYTASAPAAGPPTPSSTSASSSAPAPSGPAAVSSPEAAPVVASSPGAPGWPLAVGAVAALVVVAAAAAVVVRRRR
ncbi:copper resistance CopC family protein [Streptomyces sp. NP160]|uniref:copper resistance CopC family protein n=1 Tax=Streptomyces sp. NP160 TaxID=2586637 RepID=UPI0015D5E908|nr:copper resistance CopC family protein [Streptomyces sp. NP160]